MAKTHPFLPKFERFLTLTEAERRAILLLPVQLETVRADQLILREGSEPRRTCVLVEGVSCTSKLGPNSRRQITAFHIAEDMPDLTSLHLEVRDSDIWAITDCTLAYVDRPDLDRLCEEQRRLAKFLWRLTLVEASIHREWTLGLGLRDALGRMAHLFCEMMTRMEFIGRAESNGCALPVTQSDLGEATGISNVHVNRILQDLRERQLISFGRGRLTIHDRKRLEELGDFRTGYLHLPSAIAKAA